MSYNQHRGAPSGTPTEPLSLQPPLKLLWSVEGVGAEPMIREGLCCVWAVWSLERRALLCLDDAGSRKWAIPCDYVRFAMTEGRVLAVAGRAGEDTFHSIESGTGRVLSAVRCEYHIDKVLEAQGVFVGATKTQPRPDAFRTTLAAIRFGEGVDVLWKRECIRDYSSHGGGDDQEYDGEVACDDSRVFVRRGSSLVSLDLRTGQDVWASPLGDVGGSPTMGGKSVPMVSDGVVVISTVEGTAAFRATDGRLAWYFPEWGARTVFGGRVYVVTLNEYHVLDLQTGSRLLHVPLARRVEGKWRLKQVQFSSQLAVSETHGFIGDLKGRLYAFERDTGDPVWMDRPEGITAFAGNIPVIAGNRLYISSFSMEPAPPPRLYCYEQA